MASTTFSKEEKAARREAAAEAKAAKAGADMEAACRGAIEELTGTDQELAQTLHELVKEHAALKPKTRYGMPAYINASPHTDWLPPQISRDSRGFSHTGPTLADLRHRTAAATGTRSPMRRAPQACLSGEMCVPGR